MWKPSWMATLCLMFGIVGMSQHWQKAGAAGGPVPNPCPQFECKQITYYWDGNAKTITAIFVAGDNKTLTTTAMTDIYTTTSAFKKPAFAAGPKMDIYTCPGCSPMCGKDANGVWQAVQEVAPAGDFTLSQQGALQWGCTAAPNGGPTNANPTNSNINKNVPPGWTN